MAGNKFKVFFIISGSIFFISIIVIAMGDSTDYLMMKSLYVTFFLTMFAYMFGIHKPMLSYFDNKYYKEQEEIDFQKNLRRELQRKRSLSQIDNENLHYQNQLRIEYIAQVAQIHLQSNQYLANMYQQAIINNSTQNELTAQRQLLELEAELKKQGLI